MPDKFDAATRSRIMSRIRSKDTQPELDLRKALWAEGLKYRLHRRDVCNADVVFPKEKVAVFVDGEFWHGYNWKVKGKVPPKKYWQAKIQRNMDRDERYNKELRKGGWLVIRFWETEVQNSLPKCVSKVKSCVLRRRDDAPV